ncbi:MAG: hypothetical protein RI897_4409 [Verrucomicrobiota bacterium]
MPYSGREDGGLDGAEAAVTWGLDGAEAAVTFGVFVEGVEELGFSEVGPERGGDDEFGVGDLPEEEVRDAEFAAGADEEVRVGHMPGVEVFGEGFFVDLGGVELAFLHFGGEAAAGFDDFVASAVAEGERESEAVIIGEGGAGFLELFLDELG